MRKSYHLRAIFFYEVVITNKLVDLVENQRVRNVFF